MSGRTVPRWVRFYMDGYDLSGYSRTIGPLNTEFEEADLTAQMGDAVRGYLPNLCNLSPGTLNGVFDNTATSGLHAIASAIASERVVMVPIGNKAAPAAGDPTYCGQFMQIGYQAEEDGGAVTATIPFGPWEAASQLAFPYTKVWGHLLHANSAVTAANSSGTGVDQIGSSSSRGGYMCYQIFAGTGGSGLATITVEHSVDEVDGNYGALSGCTTGEIDMSANPAGGLVSTTAQTTGVKKYLRWQIAFAGGGATSVTFALAFIRGF